MLFFKLGDRGIFPSFLVPSTQAYSEQGNSSYPKRSRSYELTIKTSSD